MKLSRLGQLMEKWDHSGINGAEIISDNELKELSDGLQQQHNIGVDFGDKIAAFYFLNVKYRVDSCIFNRNEK